MCTEIRVSILECAASMHTMDRFDSVPIKACKNNSFVKSPSHGSIQVGSALCKMYSCAALQQLEEVRLSQTEWHRCVHFTTMVIPW